MFLWREVVFQRMGLVLVQLGKQCGYLGTEMGGIDHFRVENSEVEFAYGFAHGCTC